MTHTAKHTPGPWYPHYAKADHCLSSSVWGQEPGNQVAVIGGKSLETMNANASLIAAAPAMYEALKMARWLSNECECHESWNAPEGNLCGHCTADLAIKTALSQAEGKHG